MADANHYTEAADGLEEAAKALRACGQEESDENESDETPRSKQPENLKDAAKETKRRFAQARGEKPRDEND